jgi:hypothetical protein
MQHKTAMRTPSPTREKPPTREEIVEQILSYSRRGFQPRQHDVRRLLDWYLSVAARDAPDWNAISRAAADLDRATRSFEEEFPAPSQNLNSATGTISLRGAVPMREFRRTLRFWKQFVEQAKKPDPARMLAVLFAGQLYTRRPPAQWPCYHDIARLFYQALVGCVPEKLNLRREIQAVRRVRA